MNERLHILPCLCVIDTVEAFRQHRFDFRQGTVRIGGNVPGVDQPRSEMLLIDRRTPLKIEYIVVKIPALDAALPRTADDRMDFSCEQGGHIIHFHLIRNGQQPVFVLE